jgi:hypothetical protein
MLPVALIMSQLFADAEINCFVDESNMHDAKTYYIGVLAIRKERGPDMVARMNEIRQHAVWLTGDPDIELHGQEIFQGGGSFHGIPPHERIFLLSEIAKAIGVFACRLCIKPYNYAKASPLNRFPPHLYALAWSLENIETSFRNSSWSVTADHNKDLNDRVKEVLCLCRRAAALNCRKFSNLCKESPNFVDSRDCLLVQACDVGLYLVARHETNQTVPGRDKRSSDAVEKMCRNIGKALTLKSCWPPEHKGSGKSQSLWRGFVCD